MAHVRIKTIDVLVKEFQSNPDIQDDCQVFASKLIEQQQACQNWLDKFQELFNRNEQFEPKGGNEQIDDLLKEGESLELKLKEYVDLQVH